MPRKDEFLILITVRLFCAVGWKMGSKIGWGDPIFHPILDPILAPQKPRHVMLINRTKVKHFSYVEVTCILTSDLLAVPGHRENKP